MKKILFIFLAMILLVACKQDEFIKYKTEYIEQHGIKDVEDITTYEDKPYIEGVIFKGTIDGTEENLYFCEGLPGKSEGVLSNGEYTASLLDIDEGMSYQVYDGENYQYDKSYFVGIAYQKMTSLHFKGESIDFKTVNFQFNDKNMTLTVWLMPFDNGDDISLSDFEYIE